MRKHHGFAAAILAGFALVAAGPAPLAAQSMERDGYVLPPAPVQELFKRDKNIATLDRLSPDGDHFLIPKFQELTDLKLMSQRTLRLAMLELVPAVNREWRLATYGNEGLSLYSLAERRSYPVKIPAGAFVSDMRWSPDGRQLAFVALVAFVSTPLQSAVSREIEARADVHALDHAQDPQAFAQMQRRLALASKADVTPNRVVYRWFGSHPKTTERMAIARAWAERHGVEVPGPLVASGETP